MTELEKELFADREKLNRGSDCAVRALSIATHKPYSLCHGLLLCLGRAPGSGTPPKMVFDALDCLGYKALEVTDLYDSRTVRTFQRQAKPHLTYFVFTKAHILCVRNGTVHDWTNGKLHRVRAIYIVDTAEAIERLTTDVPF